MMPLYQNKTLSTRPPSALVQPRSSRAVYFYLLILSLSAETVDSASLLGTANQEAGGPWTLPVSNPCHHPGVIDEHTHAHTLTKMLTMLCRAVDVTQRCVCVCVCN